ncbi:methionine adenosyltransferase [Mesomycoplasma molare]|uniref:Methionine adenosyltransferase n=1 Tax=Mesomycoplasma molare TaxID=171288 RepID=A0ABY5TTQ0_9BACT|nr:methionine adenosyltransferase [Mesomycoplasma molare]UWD34040.1 methionine adenosyltransferase [Mesomycoplasma molare]
MNKTKKFISAEAVGIGHPDKIADKISDVVADYLIEKADNKQEARTAIETLISGDDIIVRGEFKAESEANKNLDKKEYWKSLYWNLKNEIIDKVFKPLRDKKCYNFNIKLSEQSEDIAQAVDKENQEIGAGDQGIVYGYATNESENFLPIAFNIATRILQEVEERIRNKTLLNAGYDMKSQVILEKTKDNYKVHTVILSVQHSKNYDEFEFKTKLSELIKKAAKVFLPNINYDFNILINSSGQFIKGGAEADAGVTGRKLMVDTYGTIAHHGGGAFSGKDFTKVDRSGAYIARYIAKNLVKAQLVDKAEVQLTWAIGKPTPLSININTFKTNKVPVNLLIRSVRKFAPLKVKDIIEKFNKQEIKFSAITNYGHFNNQNTPWEQTDIANKMKRYVLAQLKKRKK